MAPRAVASLARRAPQWRPFTSRKPARAPVDYPTRLRSAHSEFVRLDSAHFGSTRLGLGRCLPVRGSNVIDPLIRVGQLRP